jgi:hypothetical protein
MGTHTSRCELDEAAGDDAGDLFAIVATFENVWDDVDLRGINLDSALRKRYLALRRAVLTSYLDGKSRYRYKLVKA